MRGARRRARESASGGAVPRAGGPRRLLAAAVAVAAIAMLIPAPAPHAGVKYPDPRVLDRPGHGDVLDPHLALDPAGRATVVWADFEPGGGRGSSIRSVGLGPDGAPVGPVRTLSEGGAGTPALAVDRAGRATVAWVRLVGVRERSMIEFVRLGPDGTPEGPVQTLPDARGTDPQVAVDASGRATIVWARGGGGGGVRLLRLGANGAPEGPVQTLSERGRGAPRLAVGPAGRATVVWGGTRGALEALVIGADGAPGPMRELESRAGSRCAPVQWQVAADRSGRATVVWRGCRKRWEVYAARLGADGKPGRVRALSETWAKLPQVAVDRSGRATVVWQGKRAGIRGRSRIRAVRLSSGGKPGTVRIVSKPGRGAKLPQVAVDPRGRSTVVWARDDGVSTRVQAVRLGANGKPGRVRTLSAPGRPPQANACCPRVAVDGRGRATVVWRRYDGKRFRIEATRSR